MGKAFLFLWTSQLFANFGDVLYIVGLISILYGYGESTLFLAMLPFLNTIGRMVSGIFVPLFTNRYRLKTILIVTQLGKSIFLLLLYLNLSSELPIQFIFMTIVMIALLDGLMMPVTNSMAPRLVEKQHLIRANSLLAVVHEITQLGGWALGGVLVALTNGTLVVFITCVLYIIASMLIFCIVDSTSFEKVESTSKKQELVEGYRIIWNHSGFKTIHVVIFLEAMANVVWIAAIMYIFVAQVLQASEVWWGYINTAFFIGLLLAGMISVKVEKLLQRYFFSLMVISLLLVASSTLLFGLNKFTILAILLSCVCGFFEQIKGVIMHTWIQQNASDGNLVKIYSAQVVLVSAVFGVTALIFGYLASIIAVQVLFVIASLVLLISCIYLLMNKHHFV